MDYQEIDWRKVKALAKLKDLSTPPRKLYYQGEFNAEIFSNCVAVVGSRKMTDYGERVVEKIIPQLVAQGKTIVSGFMYGVDQYAHKICCESKGKTIAVLGWGIDYKLSGDDLKLSNTIIETGGILLSEWGNQKPTHWSFPLRNRIVAALSKEVIVIEAAMQSGSLITARIANSLNRTVWAVPGPITSRTSLGTNKLIAENKAKIWLGQQSQMPLLQTDDPILRILDTGSYTADELARKLAMPVAEIGAKLSMLLLSGQIMEKGGKYYIAENN